MLRRCLWLTLVLLILFATVGCPKKEPAEEREMTEATGETEEEAKTETPVSPTEEPGKEAGKEGAETTAPETHEEPAKEEEKPAKEIKGHPQVTLTIEDWDGKTVGKIIIELYPDKAPKTVANFIKLVEAGFYDGISFHRYEEGFVIQGGDPTGTGTGGSDETIPLEISDLRHKQYAVGMARTDDPNSATSQFYITLRETPSLDGSYAVFGYVIEGKAVVDRMISAYLEEHRKMGSAGGGMPDMTKLRHRIKKAIVSKR